MGFLLSTTYIVGNALLFTLGWIAKVLGLWVLYALFWFLISSAFFYARRIESSALTVGQCFVFGLMNTIVHMLIYLLCKIICY